MRETVLVTGASRGIGRRLAEMFEQQDLRVLAAVRTPGTAPKSVGIQEELLDVADASSIAAMVGRFVARNERLDVVVNNAGVYQGSYSAIWATNVRGPWLLTRGLAPLLNDGARVVMVSSGLARGAAHAGLQASLKAASLADDSFERMSAHAPGGYGASKAALNRIAELFAEELRPRGIRVNAISPGWVRTEMGGSSAPRSILEGANSVLWGCRDVAELPTGGFFEDGRALSR